MEKSGWRKVLLGMMGLLWFIAIVAMYYVSHKPVTPQVVLNIGLMLWRLTVPAAIISVGGALGSFFLKGVTLNPLTRLALQAALGLGILAVSVLAVGAFIGINWMMGASIFIMLLVLFKRARAWWANWRGLAEMWRTSDGFGRLIAACSAVLMLFTLIVALAPPLWFDALSTHLLLPQSYLADGRVTYLPWQVMSGMPQNVEMLFALAMSLAGAQAATTLCWGFSLLAVLGLLGYLNTLVGMRAAWVAVAALLAGYSTLMLSASGYVEWLALLFGLGVLVMLDDWRQRGESKALLFAGIFTGLAVGTKYTAGIVAFAGLAALIWHIYKRKAPLIPNAACYGLSAVAAALPWFIKNWITTGNPIYPFFFGGGAMTDLRMQVWQNVPTFGNWLDIVFLPIRATSLGLEGAAGYMSAIGPLLLAFGALAWLGREKRSTQQTASLENAAWIGLIGLAGWALGNQYSGRLIQTRYYFSLFPAFATLAGFGYWGLSRLNLGPLRLRRVMGIFVPLVLVFNLLEAGTQTIKQDALRAAVGLRSEADYVADNLGWYQPAMWGARDLPVSSSVLLLYEARGYYCAPVCVADEVLDRWKGDLDTYQTYEAVIRAWREQGFTHVMAYTAGMEFLRTAGDPNHPPEDMDRLDELLDQLDEVQDFGRVYTLYLLP